MAQQNQSTQENTNKILNKNNKISNDIDKLYNICFLEILPGTIFNGDATKILQILINIMNKCNKNQLQNIGPNQVLPCSIKILYLCNDEFHKSSRYCEFIRGKNYKKAKSCYYNLLKIFIPKQTKLIKNIVIHIIHNEGLWQWEDLCCDIIYGLVNNGIDEYNIVYYLLNKIEEEETNSQDAKLIIRVLNISILEYYLWPNTKKTVKIIMKFLKILRSGINNSTDLNVKNKYLKQNIQLCIRKMIRNLSNDHCHFIIVQLCSWTVEENINENTIFEFSEILEYAANLQKTKLLKTTLTNKLFILLMRMISSTTALVNLLGNRVFQYLIDRKKNRLQFESPQIFFENMKYEININPYNKKDKQFFKRYRELFHDTFIEGLMKHSSIRLNLECMYGTICLVAVEIPCGFIAAALVCLIMNIQDLTLGFIDMTRENSNHIHIIIIGIMTLICWIHHAKILYSYVNQVMMERAQWAPHLNPPLKTHYSYALHHVLWNKPEHFFVDWEVRFGLWKCFRSHLDKDDDKSKIITPNKIK